MTACLPDDWRARAVRYEVPNLSDVLCLCPDPDDVALSKLCAWRDEDRDWIAAGLGAGVLRLDVMAERSGRIANPNAPSRAEIERRLGVLAARMRPGGA